ncbi:efflux RND transporter periplasmic adaptor subunit [Bradyrhizobium sp. SRS-191]|uniref:efflux RND transporter periplasmic adaptor subunit n=1 Tax=Bradyrhizobium sp. SRS-191 TaxID=2962606 RepID=UPI00211F112D|nr:efflux RND transporter periplasmic adaptor subunit [Bradyrhizobium sp. SRS-191]
MVRHPMRAVAACGAILWALISAPSSRYALAETGNAGGREPATVKLSATQQKQVGLQTAVLAAESHPEQIRAYGTVLDVARLTELTNNYANAQAQLQTAQARLEVARLAYERARDLVQSAAMPKKDAEAAEGTFRTDQAALAAAESQVKTLMATARQEWGAVIGRGIIERSPQLVQLIEREQLLVQVTLPPGVTLAEPPRSALAQAPTRSANIDLRYLSPAPRTDPRIQGVSYYFVAAGDSGLLPGMNTTAYVPSGKSYAGVFVEDTAIVQWQGRAWVYLRAGPETFKRYPIRTDQPVSDDDYVVQDIPAGSELVMRGAQVLLSEEAKSELRGGDDD